MLREQMCIRDSFYRDVMYREGAEGKDEAYLKLYDGHDWKWFCVRLEHTDMEYLRKYWSGKKASAPTLEKRHQKYFLRFSYTEEVTLTKTPVKEQIICSVDLGINTDAVSYTHLIRRSLVRWLKNPVRSLQICSLRSLWSIFVRNVMLMQNIGHRKQRNYFL